MRLGTLLIAACVTWTAADALAQGAPDPFGPPPAQQQPASDPFGPAPAQQQPARDPFGAAPAGAQPAAPFGAPAPRQAQGADPFGPQQRPQQQVPPCVAEFFKLRDDAQKKAGAIQKASERKASPKEACGLFTQFSASEAKMLKYAVANQSSCGIPDEVIKQIKTGHGRTNDIKTKVCQAAAAPPRPAGPSLSDALSAPIPGANNIRSGGTFDTLTGNPLVK
jgi:hypothetical protein